MAGTSFAERRQPGMAGAEPYRDVFTGVSANDVPVSARLGLRSFPRLTSPHSALRPTKYLTQHPLAASQPPTQISARGLRGT